MLSNKLKTYIVKIQIIVVGYILFKYFITLWRSRHVDSANVNSVGPNNDYLK